MKTRGLALTLGLGMLITGGLEARPVLGKRMMRRRRPPQIAPGDVHFRTDFALLTAKPTMRAHTDSASSSQTGTTIAATDRGALAIDAETGMLSLLAENAELVDSMRIGENAGLLVVDRASQTVFAADRKGDRIVILSYADKLHKLGHIVTSAEPYGLALTPDGGTLLVTSVAGRKLQAFDTGSRELRWNLDIGPEARAVTVSPDGAEAVVSFLGTSAIARVNLRRSKPKLHFKAISVPRSPTEPNNPQLGANQAVPERFARNAFAATFVGDTAVVAYQQSTPLAVTRPGRESRGTYGGSAEGNPPLLHRLAFMPRGWNAMGRAHVRVQMPRALSYDSTRDALYIADMANDEIVAIADAAKPGIRQERRWTVKRDGERCGPDGVTVAPDGDLFVHCSFDKRVARIERNPQVDKKSTNRYAWSPSLGKSQLSAAAQRGRNLFHKGNDGRLSQSGGMACGNCHPEGRNDGLSWRIQGTELQTPLLAGRMVGTHPFKWDGQDKDLHTSLMHTVVRLGGTGIRPGDARDLQAYLESLPRVRVKTRAPTGLVAARKRGKRLFNSKEVGCRSCHSGKNYSDGKSYEFSDDIAKVNTPSLSGLAASAPYYHDGSAPTLRALVLENGSIHGMGHMESLRPRQVDDLVAFLETL